MSNNRFQVVSDLHLETPSTRPSYGDFHLESQAPFLALLGDIGSIPDNRLFSFIEKQLYQFEVVFFLLGNHEPYGTTFETAREIMHSFQERVEILRAAAATASFGRFVCLHQTRYDISGELTVLGCTLFSQIAPKQEGSIQLFVSDFSEIQDWSIANHRAAHQSDLTWLNDQVAAITQQEPSRRIVVFTHYSPTKLETANDPKHLDDAADVNSAFVTDLSNDVCWSASQVKLWAFGHTHFNCDFEEPRTGKRVFANQKGYRRKEMLSFDANRVVQIA